MVVRIEWHQLVPQLQGDVIKTCPLDNSENKQGSDSEEFQPSEWSCLRSSEVDGTAAKIDMIPL